MLLVVACLALAALTPLEIRMIGAGLAPVLPTATVTAALKSPWVLQPVFAGFSILSPSWLWVVIPALFAVVAMVAWLASGTPAATGTPRPRGGLLLGRVRTRQLHRLRLR